MKSESIKAYSYRISQASPAELVVIMYDMAIEYLNDGIAALEKNAHKENAGKEIQRDCAESVTQDAVEEFRKNLKYAKRVIDRLAADLDMQYEVSEELLKLYRIMDRYIVKASAEKDMRLIVTVCGMLSKLRNSFYEISREDKSGPIMQNTQQVYAGLTYSNAGNSNEYSKDPVNNRGFMV